MTISLSLQKAFCFAFPGVDETVPRLRALLVGFAFSTIAQFLFSSIMAIHLSGLGLSPTAIGIAAFCFYTCLRCQGPISAVLTDNFGIRPVYACGVLLSALGYLGFAFNTAHSILLLSVTAIGIGLGLDALCRSVMLVQESQTKEIAHRALTLYYVVFNVAASIAPLLSSVALIAGRSTHDVYLAAGVIQGLTGASFLLFFPFSAVVKSGAEKQPGLQPLRIAWRSPVFRSFLVRLPLIWFVFSVMHAIVPVFLIEWIHIPKATLSSMFSLNAVLVVFFGHRVQTRLTNFITGRGLSKFYGMALGSALMAIGIFSLLLGARFPSTSVYIFMTIFSFGEICFIPMVQAIVNDCVPEGATSSAPYFGLASLAWGVGAALSNLLGGIIVEVCRQYGYAYFPLLFGCAALGIGANYFHLGRRGQLK